MHAVLRLPLSLLLCVLCRAIDWPQKSSLFLFRTDGMSCSRELVTGMMAAAAAAAPANVLHSGICSACMQTAADASAVGFWMQLIALARRPRKTLPLYVAVLAVTIRTYHSHSPGLKSLPLYEHSVAAVFCHPPVPPCRHRALPLCAPQHAAAAPGVAGPAQGGHGNQETGP
jgi:hypothetical protein